MLHPGERKFPMFLSDPFQVLWLQSDDLLLCVGGFMMGNFLGGWFWSTLILLPVMNMFLKKSQPRGYIKHLFYVFCLAIPKHYPEYFDREFLE